ncbi:hypothetical protein PGT21_027850 [Puccinia graminis f. sp. tritici]|uniref:Uncharacterized protein n=2 Tax=Puccinia graminis f. sp. tritici TaxID=56615 RepID=E3JRQ9_PUCGT|nr:uncharacterized protein PGTG_00591 [Puccinia graminis f. sp. tritici CRL 75-36-700-3]EFP74635.1 hypothetical protein PGTG_00591 [Puccinia graminis f. sp. tritici CRL 75-36-700-3]KAA1114953.1 hypothetical protein PGT21_027850 [Puccinia graminis f. sp. tritici]
MSNSSSQAAPPLEEGEISQEERDPPPRQPANQTYSIHGNPLINAQADNEPRVYASAKARKVMARVQRLAVQAPPTRPRRADSYRANEGRSRGEFREFNRGNHSRRWHPARRFSDSRPGSAVHQRSRARTSFTDEEDENEYENFDRHSNQDFPDYHQPHPPPHHHHRHPPDLDRLDRQPVYPPDQQYDHPEIYPEQPHHPEIYPDQPHHPEIYQEQPHRPDAYHEQPPRPEAYHEQPHRPEVYRERPHHPEVYHERLHHPEVYHERPHPPEVHRPEVYHERHHHPEPHRPEVYHERPHRPEAHHPETYHERPHQPEVHHEQPHHPEVRRPEGYYERPHHPEVRRPEVYHESPHHPEVHRPEVYHDRLHHPETYHPEVYHERPPHPEVHHEQPHPPEVYRERPPHPEVYREQPHPPEVYHEQPHHPGACHEQSHQPLYPGRTSTQSSSAPTPHHHAHPPNLVPNYPPSHYNPYPPPPVRPPTVPLQPVREYEALNDPTSNEYEAAEQSPFQSHQVLRTPQSATIPSDYNPHSHQPHEPHLTTPEVYYPPQAPLARPVSQPATSNHEVHVKNQPPYYPYHPEHQRQPTYQLPPEQPIREPYPPGPSRPQPLMTSRLVPNYPAPPTHREFHPPTRSSTVVHGYPPPPASHSSNPEVLSANQSPHYQYEGEQQRHLTYQYASEQPPWESSSSHPPHPQPITEARLVPNYPVPPTHHEFHHPPQSSRSVNGCETVRPDPFRPEPLPIHHPPAPAGFPLEPQHHPHPHHHHHHHYHQLQQQKGKQRLQTADEPVPFHPEAFPVDPYHHKGPPRRAFAQIEESGPVHLGHASEQYYSHHHSDEDMRYDDDRPEEIKKRSGREWEGTSLDFDFASKKKEAQNIMRELFSWGVSAEYLVEIGISESLVRETRAKLSRRRDLSHVVDENLSAREGKQDLMDSWFLEDRDREPKQLLIRSPPPRRSSSRKNGSAIQGESSLAGPSTTEDVVDRRKETGPRKECVDRRKEEGASKPIEVEKTSESRTKTSESGTKTSESRTKTSDSRTRSEAPSQSNPTEETRPTETVKKKRERATTTTTKERREAVNEDVDRSSNTTGSGLRRSLRNQSKKIRVDVPPFAGLPTPSTPTER